MVTWQRLDFFASFDNSVVLDFALLFKSEKIDFPIAEMKIYLNFHRDAILKLSFDHYNKDPN